MVQLTFKLPQNRELFLKTVVALLNGLGGKLEVSNIDMQSIKLLIENNIFPIPDYWLKMKNEKSWVIRVDNSNQDSFVKEEYDYGFRYIRYVISDNEVVAATKEMKEKNSFKRKNVKFICKSIKGSYILDERVIEKKATDIIDELILFVRRNTKFSKQNGWNFDFDLLREGIDIVLEEYSYYQSFPIEFFIIDEEQVTIKYLLGKDIYDGNDSFDVEDEIFLENRIRTLAINSKEMDNIISIDFTKEKKITKINKIEKNKKIKKLDLLLKLAVVPVTSKELMNAVGLKDRETFYNNYLKPAIKQGYLTYTIPDKPRSPKQRYVISEKVKALDV